MQWGVQGRPWHLYHFSSNVWLPKKDFVRHSVPPTPIPHNIHIYFRQNQIIRILPFKNVQKIITKTGKILALWFSFQGMQRRVFLSNKNSTFVLWTIHHLQWSITRSSRVLIWHEIRFFKKTCCSYRIYRCLFQLLKLHSFLAVPYNKTFNYNCLFSLPVIIANAERINSFRFAVEMFWTCFIDLSKTNDQSKHCEPWSASFNPNFFCKWSLFDSNM